MEDELFTEKEITDQAIDIDNAFIDSGIYFLIKSSRIVYIGKSSNMMSRIVFHLKKGVDFDSYTTMQVIDEKDRTDAESIYIQKFNPILNKIIPKTDQLLNYEQVKSFLRKHLKRNYYNLQGHIPRILRENQVKFFQRDPYSKQLFYKDDIIYLVNKIKGEDNE